MSEQRFHCLVIYDIREPARWRKAYKLLKGYGQRIQYSVFRCSLSLRDHEKLRWELEKKLDAEDSVLFIGLCDACVSRVVARNRPDVFLTEDDQAKWRVL
jgi:CRISPR-associated protein Cas2